MIWNRLPAQAHCCRSGRAMALLIAVGATVVIGCSGTTIRKDQWVSLPADTPYQSMVKNTDYAMEYQLVRQPADDSGTGKLVLKGKLVPRRGLDSLSIWINFLDVEGKIIGSKTLYSPGAGRGAARTSLEKTFEIPPGTVSVAFTHNAREKGPVILG